MYGVLLFENDMADEFDTIHPKEMIMSKNSLAVNDLIRLTVPSIITLNSWLSEEQEYHEQNKFDFSAIPTANI